MHGLKMTEYNKKYGSSLLYRSWHTCQICGIRWEVVFMIGVEA